MKPHLSHPGFTAQETQFIQRLRQQPQRLARLQSSLHLAHATDGPLKADDEVEALLIQELRQLGRTTPDEEAPVRTGHRYLNHRLDCLDYPGALALGLPIGSGMIQSGHRHVLPARLKKADTAWLPDHADQPAHRRVLRAHDQWLSLWN